jgi:2-iminoacetate synthase ThiH
LALLSIVRKKSDSATSASLTSEVPDLVRAANPNWESELMKLLPAGIDLMVEQVNDGQNF